MPRAPQSLAECADLNTKAVDAPRADVAGIDHSGSLASQVNRNIDAATWNHNQVVHGHFIVTTPDANDYVRCVRDAPRLKFGDDEFHIKFHGSKDGLLLFRELYNFHMKGVVDCPKFL
ncbi:hypothetical protein MRX96_049911 [Rhipicephalus microplus]